MKISEVVAKLDRKEWLLPPFQRDYVWNDKKKVLKFVDSIYRGYPIGSVIIWKPHIKDINKLHKFSGRPINAPTSGKPVWSTEFILDGQQRLTTISRIFAGAPFVFGEDIYYLHYDIDNEEFCFLKKGNKEKNIVPFYDIMNEENKALIDNLQIKDKNEIIRITSLIEKVRKINDRELNYEITQPLEKKDALELFIRLNTGGKSLETENLALGYISIKWHDARNEFESFRNKIQKTVIE